MHKRWKLPPPIKIYEALGAIADGRVELINKLQAKATSSSDNKTYEVLFNPDTGELSVNDNGSYYQGYVGYPALAVLMIKGILPFNETLSEKLKGIHWKQLNQENKNDFDKTVAHLFTLASQHELEAFAQEVLAILKTLTLHRPNDIPKPPSGW
jgi:hypothetical protein